MQRYGNPSSDSDAIARGEVVLARTLICLSTGKSEATTATFSTCKCGQLWSNEARSR
jgi:hypothetical protein